MTVVESIRTCSIGDCENDHHARGWCQKHYHRWRKHGNPTTVVLAPAGELDEGELREIEALRRGEREWRYDR